MANYLDYLRWRGDIMFEKENFNDIDAVIFSMLVYLPFEKYSKKNSDLPLQEVAQEILAAKNLSTPLNQEQRNLLQLVIKSPRFSDCKVINPVNQVRINPPLQFSAVTFNYKHNRSVIAYRGTDRSVTGWNEDMTMSYSDKIEGQQTAADYLEKIAMKLPTHRFNLVGHSKGGNFAIFAGAFTHTLVQHRIRRILNFDGPGFVKEVYSQPGYQRIKTKAKTIIPQGSVVGLMLDHIEPVEVVRSSKNILFQHNPITWDIARNYFIEVKNVSKNSSIIDQSITNWLQETPPEEREELWNAIFDSLSEIKVTQVDQITSNMIKGILDLNKIYRSLSPENRQVAKKIIDELVKNININYNFTLKTGK